MLLCGYFDPDYITKQQTWSRAITPGMTYKYLVATPIVIYEESMNSSLSDRGTSRVEYKIDFEYGSLRLEPLSPTEYRKPVMCIFKSGELITFRLRGLDPITLHGYFSPEENSPPEPIENNPVWMKTPWIMSHDMDSPKDYHSFITSDKWRIVHKVVPIKHLDFDLYDKWFRIKKHSKYHKDESFPEEPKTRQASASCSSASVTSVKTVVDKSHPKHRRATEDHQEERPPKKTKACQCDLSNIGSPLGNLLKSCSKPGPKPIQAWFAHKLLCAYWRQDEYDLEFLDLHEKAQAIRQS